MTQPTVVDFETDAIQPRPLYPPIPRMVAIKYPGKKSKFLAWAMPDGNNCTKEQAGRELRDIWRGEVLFHNAKFDLDVAEVHFGLKPPPWHDIHDTLFSLFLADPHAVDLSLKPSAEKYLGWPAEERDAIADWLRKNGIIQHNEKPGPYICKAPTRLVGPYACGDVERTLALHQLIYEGTPLAKVRGDRDWGKPTRILADGKLLDKRMKEAYDRERKLMPHLLKNESEGLRVDCDRLATDLKEYEAALAKAEGWLRKKLCDSELNFDDAKAVGDALFKTKIVTNWQWTKGGKNRPPQRSVAKDNLGPERFNDPLVASALGYRTRLHTVLANSMRPWLASASAANGIIYTQWNQVRRHDEGQRKSKGARTGRVTASRFLNVSKNWLNKGDGFIHPKKLKLPDLPLVRKYIYPDKGMDWNHRDTKQQEFRVAAHYEDGPLAEKFRADPNFDIHDGVREVILTLGNEELAAVDRVIIKNFNHGILYFEGVDLLCVKTKMPRDKVIELRNAIKAATPGIQMLVKEVIRRGKCGEPIRTWGGRIYHCEPPAIAKKGPRKGEVVTFEYKLFSYLIQGSSADATKEALCRYFETRKNSRLLNTIYDEINICAPKKDLAREDKLLKEAMEGLEFDVPMWTDRKLGPSWGELKKLEE